MIHNDKVGQDLLQWMLEKKNSMTEPHNPTRRRFPIPQEPENPTLRRFSMPQQPDNNINNSALERTPTVQPVVLAPQEERRIERIYEKDRMGR